MNSRNAVLSGALALALTALAGCASLDSSTSSAPDRPLQPLVVGWEQYFELRWQSELRGGLPIIWGRIFNNGGFPAIRIQLLVEGLDPAGDVTEQKVARLFFGLAPGTTAPFEVALSRPASTYRVSVFAFDWDQKDL